ncbi:hypothetical protein SEUCBS139899_010466 [Sporothrix eucalyptigena]|uniref:Uncharacterized protein n=1 Tax=Sporothrix eucalyptigena TaxID=1812306 RepID=A0ABP0CQ47_9PEZI
MSSFRQEVFDSDDDGDVLSPLSSPLASPNLSPAQPYEETSQPELPELPELPLSTNAADTSASTDPSFFRDVYEEQQRALGAQLLATAKDHDERYATTTAASTTVERDPWEVPSSPIEVAGQQRESYLKRKRDEERQRNNVSVVVQLNDISSGSGEPAAKQRKTAGTNNSSLGQGSMGLEISIPLEPLTPGRMNEFPHLLSSSINNSMAVPHDESLPPLRAASALQTPYNDSAPNDAVTQSTIAFTTPSIYSSSGRRAQGSSNNNNNTNSRQIKSSHDMDVIQENEAAAVCSTTPPRKARKAADLAQILSSPDIIAEPTGARKLPRQQSPKIEEHGGDWEDQEEDADWEAHTSYPAKATSKPSQRHPRRRASVEDELSISIDVPAQNDIVHEIGEADASYDSPPKKAVPKAKSKQQKSKAVFIAASDDDDDEIDEVILPPAGDSESDFSDASAKPKPKAKTKKEQKKKEATADPAQGKPKRTRGRPKKSKQADEEDEKADAIDPDDNYEAVMKVELPEAEVDTEADAKSDSKTEQAQTKGKRGKKAKKGGRGCKSANTTTEAVPIEITIDDTALSKTSGNASVPSSFKGIVDGEENKKVKDEEKAEEKEEEKPLPSISRPTLAPAGLPTGLLSTGLNTTGQGRVPYRVGLSKKFRIAPLLKVIRK